MRARLMTTRTRKQNTQVLSNRDRRVLGLKPTGPTDSTRWAEVEDFWAGRTPARQDHWPMAA